MATRCCHRTALGMACVSMADGLSLDTIFLVVKRRLKKSALSQVARPADYEAALKGCCPIKNLIFWRRGKWWAVLAPPLQYSPRLRRKKKVIQARSVMACCLSVPPWWAAYRA